MRFARLHVAAAVVFLGLASGGAVIAGAQHSPSYPDATPQLPRAAPSAPDAGFGWADRLAAATRFAAQRTGDVGFAVIDEHGTLRSYHPDARFESASVVKVMLMAAYLRQASVSDRELDDADRRLLAPMIKQSANGPASEIYQRVGAGAFYELAREAGMKGFSTSPFWGASTITARGQARFLYELERYLPERHRDYALGLMADIVAPQRWGIPHALPLGFSIHFKGGWAPEDGAWKINQVALLVNGERRLSLAVLTRGNPSPGYGHATVRGIAERLLHSYEYH